MISEEEWTNIIINGKLAFSYFSGITNNDYIVRVSNNFYRLSSHYVYYNTEQYQFVQLDWYVYTHLKIPKIHHDYLYEILTPHFYR